ncbi:hypothetical protein Tco_1097904, partial [Tanacetum coccineum]
IIMVNEIPPDHVDDVPVVEPNQHDDAPVVPESVLVDEDEDLKEDEFKEEEDPQEEENDMEINIEEDENEPGLTYPYEEVDPLNPPLATSESEPDNEIKVENPIEHEDETVLVSVYEQGTTAMEKLVEKLGNVKEKGECKKLKKELEEARGFVFKERPNEAIKVPIEDEKSPLSEPQGSPQIIDVAIAAERERQAKVRNDASGSGPVRGQDTAPAVRECTFAGFMKCNPTVFCRIEGVVELQRWFEKTESVFRISECLETMNRMPWTEMKQLMTAEFCPIEEI